MKNQKICFSKLYGYVGVGIFLLLSVVFLMTSVMGIKTSTNSRAARPKCNKSGGKCVKYPTSIPSPIPSPSDCTQQGQQCGVYTDNSVMKDKRKFKECCEGYTCVHNYYNTERRFVYPFPICLKGS